MRTLFKKEEATSAVPDFLQEARVGQMVNSAAPTLGVNDLVEAEGEKGPPPPYLHLSFAYFSCIIFLHHYCKNPVLVQQSLTKPCSALLSKWGNPFEISLIIRLKCRAGQDWSP